MMAYVVALLATRWGSELGGLNVFNRGLATGIDELLPKGSKTICFVNRLPAECTSTLSIEIIERPTFVASDLAIDMAVHCKQLELDTLQGVLIIGHDVVTGQIAIDCADALRNEHLVGIDVKSAVIGHMDYSAYAFMKNVGSQEVTDRSFRQRGVIEGADCAFAVGPLLQRNFASTRRSLNRTRSQVRRLVPGVDKVKLRPLDLRADLRFFISGRLNLDDDPIKNSVLSVHALTMAYERGRRHGSDKWGVRGQLFAFGVDPEADLDLITQLGHMASKDAAFTLHAEPFSVDQGRLRERLAECHVALMPSWHEGFGLTGWEALCAGVPLVCSRQSGLALLLDELKQQFPDVPFSSIEFVNVSGGVVSGTPNANDVDTLADALLQMVSNIAERKQAAIELAGFLKREFSWKRCASDLIEGTGWYFPGSVHWSKRQIAGRRQGDSREVLERILEGLDGLDLDEDWADLTTAFNNLSDAGKNAILKDRQELYLKLLSIGRAIGERMSASSQIRETARESGCMDVCWRFMAAAANICSNFKEFSQSFPESMLQAIWNDSFLTKELFHYSTSFASEFSNQASEIALQFFSPLKRIGSPTSYSTRLARLASAHPAVTSVFPGIEEDPNFLAERDRCQQVKQHAHDIAHSISSDYALASTALALMALSPDPARQVADQTVAIFREYYPDAGGVKGHWRGDKRVFAAIAMATLSTRVVVDVLSQMAEDEDESIRWGALHIAFSRTLRRRLDAAVKAGHLRLEAPLNQVLGDIIDKAVTTDGGHPWLHREFLSHYVEERAGPEVAGDAPPFTVLDFPLARWLIGPVVGEVAPRLRGKSHPEVLDTRTSTLHDVKRVLLVLPPIEIDDDASGASRTSTPPLGLGLLASHLVSLGHDVQVADCHRFPALRSEVLRLARTFDLIGFNTVFSTIRSTMRMLVDIRNRTYNATLVIGGPVAKLNAWQFSAVHEEDADKSWDFAVTTDAVANLAALVGSLKSVDPWPDLTGVTANNLSWNVVGRGLSKQPSLESSSVDWQHVVLDRRIYRHGDDQYEPARTRSNSKRFYEAHVVMSQGCDWNCIFCTERQERSGGEQRREVEHVLGEIRDLAVRHGALRIQFVDDNLLPQIASGPKSGGAKYAGLGWASDFLDGLSDIKANAGESFGWRGIFRIEDFLAYEIEFASSGFVARLQRSGCRMLAFGVEHGSEEQRKKSKVGREVVANERIVDLFRRLREADILTKSYFMLGGQWESQKSAQDTIDFAIESGTTLAYFALYKDFAKATTVLSKVQIAGDRKSEGFIHYEQLMLNWDQEFLNALDSSTPATNGEIMKNGPVTDEELSCYRELAALGFRFSDLVKYNDFHSEGAGEGGLLRSVTWDSPSEYFKTVEAAYRRFYLRPAFVQAYSSLLAHGY